MMQKYDVIFTPTFRKDYKLAQKRGYDVSLLQEVVAMLANGEALPEKYHDHSLIGNYRNCRECHIKPDWLLVYQIDNEQLILFLMRTGTHSDLF